MCFLPPLLACSLVGPAPLKSVEAGVVPKFVGGTLECRGPEDGGQW
jgi:hypothetical protein